MGIKLGDEKRDCIPNLRFADDVLVMAATLNQLEKMIADFQKSTETQGLEIHPSKTPILKNPENKQAERNRDRRDACRDTSSREKVKLLEQMITSVDQETTEVQHRIRCAWSAFATLTSQSYLPRHRSHQFDAVVTPKVTYGAGTCATTKEHEKMLRTTQRKMLRLIIGTKRNYKKKKERG